MRYPYVLLRQDVPHHPLIPDLAGDPWIADLSVDNPGLNAIDLHDQRRFQHALEAQMAPRRWGVADYLENRATLLRDHPQMVVQKRFFHLGLDVIVPCGTLLHAPLEAQVAEHGYEAGNGNYGGFVLLRHALPACETFFSLFGHLSPTSLPPVGARLQAGEPFARTGDFHENGNWFHHTHLQILTPRGLAQGYLSKGYCAAHDLPEIRSLCPSPLPLFKR
jgi:hypothetical protein